MQELLKAPFNPIEVKWRIGSTSGDKKKGMALAYIDARNVMDRLDEVCGPFGWQSKFHLLEDDKRVICSIGIARPFGEHEWVWKSDGAGETDIEAEKGSISDAFKRAGVHWGIGRYLYSSKSPWVDIVPRGKSYAIAPHEVTRLAALLDEGPHHTPPHSDHPRLEPDIYEMGIDREAEQHAEDKYAASTDPLGPQAAIFYDEPPRVVDETPHAPAFVPNDVGDIEVPVSKAMLSDIKAWPRMFKCNELKYGKHEDKEKFKVSTEILDYIGCGTMTNLKLKHWSKFKAALDHYEQHGELPS